MKKYKNYYMIGFMLIPFLLAAIIIGCDDRDGITYPLIKTQYLITLSSNPALGGTTSGAGEYDSGSSKELTATANAGYTFTNWTENGIVISSSMGYQINVTGNRTLVANFATVAPTQKIVALSSIPIAGGTTIGGGAYDLGSSVTVTATANTGYSFTNWTENDVVLSSSLSYQFIISENRNLVSNFAVVSPTQNTVSLSSSPIAGGTTIGGGVFDKGSLVTVTATANTGYSFTNWTENDSVLSSSSSYQFTLNSNKVLVANFTANVNQFTLTLLSNPVLGGVVSGDGSFDSGSLVTAAATANTGYTFTNWTENGQEVSTNANYQFTINANTTLTANFTANVNQFTLTLLSNPVLGGSVTGDGSFDSGSLVTAAATANTDYTFTNWTENGQEVSTNANYQFTINANTTLTANFTANVNQFTLTLLSNPVLGGVVSGDGTFDSGSLVTAAATANTDYTFTNWTENGQEVSTNENYQFTINANTTLTANFIANVNQFTLTLLSNPVLGGVVSGDGTFDSGSLVTAAATANTGYTFTNWTENGQEVSTNENYQFTIIANTTLTANFESSTIGGQQPVVLGSSARFAILSNSAITNIPSSSITGDVGVSPGARSSITGLTIPEVNGIIFASDDADPVPAMLIAAKNDAEAAYLDATASVRGTPTPLSGNINGLTLVPGLYESGTSIEISPGGILYLDGQGDASAVFVIRSATSITTEATSEVVLTNGANAQNIYWVSGSAVTLGANSMMKGTIIASTSISLQTGARLDGRALIQGAAAGQVSLDQSTIVLP